MKKNLFIVISLFTVSLTWCTTSDNQVIQIDSQQWEQLFNSQVENFQYIKDFEDFISYNILSITEDKPYSSDLSLSAKFDENSSIQWWIEFSQKNFAKSHDLEISDIELSVKAESPENDTEPFDLSGSVSLLYKENELYANLHSLNIFMWEWNMVAKMYTLLWDLIINNRVNLEVNSWWIISIDEKEDIKLPYTTWNIKNVLETKNIQDSPNFLGSVVELLDTINSHIDLWISTDELTLISPEISYFKLSDKSIQKIFTGSFLWKESAFDLSFTASKDWFETHIYNMKEYDEDIQDYNDTDSEILFSIQEKKKSEYSVTFQSAKYRQKIVDLEWKIKHSDKIEFSANYVLEPLEIVASQKISWKLNWTIIKQSWESGNNIPELTWNILSISEILSSL